MNFNHRLEINQSQNLIMTTQLKQSLSILNMSKDELDAEIIKESEENPLLDIEKKEDINSACCIFHCVYLLSNLSPLLFPSQQRNQSFFLYSNSIF